MEAYVLKPPNPESRYLENISFLLVEPNAFMRATVRNLLIIFGCRRVVEAGDGSQALKIMRSFMPDIIVTELDMQPVNGTDFTRTVRTGKDSSDPYVPIIMMTAYSEYRRVIEARDAGITEFVVKPLSARSLIAHVVEAIQNPRNFVATGTYFGPDRRRRRSDKYGGGERRGSGRAADAARPKIDRDAALTQDQVDEVVAGAKIEGNGETSAPG